MTGHLDIICAADAEGRSFLREQSFRAPVHISKPFHDGEMLVVNMVNPTAGLFAGDAVLCRAHVDAGAKLLLTSPSASRAHRMIEGHARVAQEFSVVRGGLLEVWPDVLIPQAGSCYRQRTRVDVEEGGDFLLIETLAPGRVASGEVFEYRRLDFEADVVFAGRLAARERYGISPDAPSLRAIRKKFDTAYYAGCFAIGQKLCEQSGWLQQIVDLQSDAVWIGCSRLVCGGFAIKVLARDSIALRGCVHELRRTVYAAWERPLPKARKL